DGVDLTLHAGEVHALIGENGAGKSTLMNARAGAVRPDRGAMQVDGRPYAPAAPGDARRRGVALIHQELCLCPHLSAAENMLLGLEPTRGRGGWVDGSAARRRALTLLEHFGGGPALDPDERVADLPLAAQQVVEICRALAADARILLMDEPTSSLQREDVDRLFALIRQLAARGIAVIYISHFLEEVREIAGLMGSGRSELVRALFGLEPRASGRIALHGRQLAVPGASPARRVAQGLGYLSEDRRREGLALALSVADNLTATRFSACSPGW